MLSIVEINPAFNPPSCILTLDVLDLALLEDLGLALLDVLDLALLDVLGLGKRVLNRLVGLAFGKREFNRIDV